MSITDFLNLEPLTDFEQADLLQIKNDFRRYFRLGKISEGLVKFITITPLMRLTGFYDVPIRLTMEDSIAIAVEDEDRIITAQMHILAINNPQSTIMHPFWVVAIAILMMG
ncbi:MAG: hypothetical protein ICV54_05790 [Nostoc sp. C3-bin3]|nr:hypothetical protein [Nostoc sp. C3-bin3]